MLGEVEVEVHCVGSLDCGPLPLLHCQISHIISIVEAEQWHRQFKVRVRKLYVWVLPSKARFIKMGLAPCA